MDVDESDAIVHTEGAIPAGNGDYVFDLDDLDDIEVGPDYSLTYGSVIEGERLQVGLVVTPAGTGSRLHTHPNEQFNYVLQGELRVIIGDQDEQMVGPGSVIYVPPNVEHSMIATPEQDVLFYVLKDRSHGIAGEPVDDSSRDPYYEPGFDPEE